MDRSELLALMMADKAIDGATIEATFMTVGTILDARGQAALTLFMEALGTCNGDGGTQRAMAIHRFTMRHCIKELSNGQDDGERLTKRDARFLREFIRTRGDPRLVERKRLRRKGRDVELVTIDRRGVRETTVRALHGQRRRKGK